MVSATDDVRDAHIDVIDHYAELVCGQTARTQQDEILDLGVL